MYRLVGFGSKRSTPENRLDPIFLSWIWIMSSWSNFLFLDFDQLELIQYFCSGFESSHVDPILFFWILIKSSWSNIFWTGFRFWKKLIFLIKIQLFWAFYAFGEIEWVLAVSRGGARESTPQMPTLAPELSFFLQYSQKYFPTLQFSYRKI